MTVVSEFPQKQPIPNYKDIALEQSPNAEIINLTEMPHPFIRKYGVLKYLAQAAWETCDKLNQKPIRDLLSTTKNFDLILIEYFNTDCFLGFVHKFKVPFIGLSSCYEMPWATNRIANPTNPSYIPNHFGFFDINMNFWERLENTVLYLYTNIIYYTVMDGDSAAKKYFGDDLPPLSVLAENTSLFLVNTFPALNGARPKVPSLIEVGGMNIGKPKRVAPLSLEKWINESTDGVIYFSMGSMIKGHTFPEDKRAMFQNAFSRLKQRVLWKWENDSMPNQPANVMLQKWMPQFEILCHPNVKAFITHGGLLGTTETVHCGVPAVVMPQFGDQYTNAKALEASGGGVILDFSTITEEDVYNALRTVLDPSFNKQAKELSARFKDRPMPPLETAVYWVEYVARHKGAPHLRSAAVGMPYYQYLLLDVIAFLAAVFLTISYVVYATCRFILSKLLKKEAKKVKKQ
ncbi:hypothetical protein Trydic_g7230 [Trypoxylus dichotomus]